MRKILLSVLVLYGFALNAQQVLISGFIIDGSNGEKLIGANIYDQVSKTGGVSNNYGFFSIGVTAGDSVELIFSYIGYKSKVQKLSAKTNQAINVELASGNLLDEVVISAENDTPIDKRNEMGVLTIPVKQIENMPAIGGESDILKALQLMPGVQSGNEGNSGIYVRGGSPDQNLILLDDVPLYYVNHLGGFVSTFNTDAISNIKLIKGGFPARYGSRLSSVIDIRMKDGNQKEFHGSAMIGMVASKISVEGPIKRDTTSYIISFRRFMYDLITKPVSKIVFDGVGIGYSFYDFNAKINHRLSDKDRLFISCYAGDDKISFRVKDKNTNETSVMENSTHWGNTLAALRWNHIYGHKLFSNTTVTYTRYRYKTELSNNTKAEDYTKTLYNSYISGIYDLNAKIDFEYFINSSYKIKFGGNGIYHTFKPGVTEYRIGENNTYSTDTVFGNYNLKAKEGAIYLENEFSLWKKINFNIGGRITSYYVNDTNFYFPEPRILTNIIITNRFSVKASYALMQQNVHLLSSSGVGMATDLWLPATKIVPPEKSQQYSLGVAQTLKNNTIEFSVEAYYKKMTNLISYKEGAIFTGLLSDWQYNVENHGVGKSYGIEFLFQKKAGRTTGWIGYTLSRTTRQFANLNNGEPFTYKYDRTHDISIVWIYNLNENVNISATWVFGTGNAFTLATGTYNIITDDGYEEVHIYDGINTFRMKPYHRLDFGINFHKQKKWGERTWNVSIYNVYNRQNPYYYFYKNVDVYGYTQRKLYQQSLFPIIPSVSYSFKF